MDNFGVIKSVFIFVLALLFIWGVERTSSEERSCLRLFFTSMSSADSCPDYCVNWTLNKEGAVRSVWTVSRLIKRPIARFALVAYKQRGQDERTVYNITAKLCEIMQIMGRNKMATSAISNAFKLSNYSFRCPMQPGVYVSNGLYVYNQNPLLTIAYKQKSLYMGEGGVSEQLSNGSIRQLSIYQGEFKIVKTHC